jgi:hypothetical protein
MSWQQVQGDVEASADPLEAQNSEIQASYADIFQETGNQEFSRPPWTPPASQRTRPARG